MDEWLWWWPAIVSTHLAAASIALLVYVVTTHGLRLHRHPSAAIAWISVIVSVPYGALPVYLMFGLRKHRRARQMPAWPRRADPDPEDDPWTRLCLGLGLPPPADHRDLVIDADGNAARQRLLALLDGATHSIDIATFTFADDELGRAVSARLEAAARRGVRVRVLVDGIGRLLHSRSHFPALRRAGVTLAAYAPLLGRPRVGRPNLRNHRKLVAVDRSRAWLGGRNLAAQYFGGETGWIDLSFEVGGPVVATLEMLFEYDWSIARRVRWVPDTDVPLAPPPSDAVLVMPRGPESADDTFQAVLVWACNQARDRIAIATPYFVPDLELLAALVCALHRGVKVQLVMPRRSNHRMADWARGRAVRDIIEAGGSVLLATRMSHAKLTVIDQRVAFAGSANVDARSLFLNHELMLGFRRKADVEAFGEWFDRLAADCVASRARPLTLVQDLKEGLAQWLTFQM
ncbi:MAG: phospholipase D-like domain-containing protein [Burkholderiaceae bacterium]